MPSSIKYTSERSRKKLRELRAELTELINSGHCGWASAFDITLTGGEFLAFSTIDVFVDRFGITRQYFARVSVVQPLEMSLEPEVDQINFSVSNVDMIMGQTLTGATRKLDGARCVCGTIFIDNTLEFEDGLHFYDPKLPGELIDGDVHDQNVDFSLFSDVDVAVISGRRIAEEFQWREPISNVPASDPNDIIQFTPLDQDPTNHGRYPGGGRFMVPFLDQEFRTL